MDKLIGIGNALVDVLATLQDDNLLAEMSLPKGSMQLVDECKFHTISDKFASMKTHQATGGSAGNTVFALANLGATPGFIGKTGRDDFGDFFARHGKKFGVDLKILQGDLPTGVASTFISPDGERTFGTYLGAASTLMADDLTLEMFRGYDYLYIEGYLVQNHDLILHAAQLAREAGCQVCIDLASYNVVAADLDFFDMLVTKYVDIVFANEEEAKAFTGKEADEAVHAIAAKCSIAVVKVGARGSLVQKGSDCHHVQTPVVKRVVDTTGAGDFYAAGFMYGLMSGYSLDKCCRIGSLLASNVIQVIGTTLPKKRWDEIKQGIDAIVTEE
jgi:sugar/nucleoside kinase (ribokinase family)